MNMIWLQTRSRVWSHIMFIACRPAFHSDYYYHYIVLLVIPLVCNFLLFYYDGSRPAVGWAFRALRGPSWAPPGSSDDSKH